MDTCTVNVDSIKKKNLHPTRRSMGDPAKTLRWNQNGTSDHPVHRAAVYATKDCVEGIVDF